MEIVNNTYLPGDPRLIDHIVYELKSQGIFDNFRKECIADVDTKPAYQNLRQRVEGSVSGFLKTQRWRSDMNKNHVREMLRKNISESGFLETGVERIVDQVVNPKINTIFLPQVENVVYKVLGIQKPTAFDDLKKEDEDIKLNLLPNDLEAVSPESDRQEKKLDVSNESHKVDDKLDDDESPPFEPLEETTVAPEENSVDSNLSGISGLASHDSNHSIETMNKELPVPMEISNQDSQFSKQSSEDHLSIVMSDEQETKLEMNDDSNVSSIKMLDTNSKSIDMPDSQSSSEKNLQISSSSEKIEETKVNEEKRNTEKKSDRHHSSHKHSSSHKSSKDHKNDRKSDRDRKDHRSSKSSHDSKERKDRDKEKKDKPKSEKDTDTKSKDSKTDRERHNSSSRHSKDKTAKRDSSDGKSKDSSTSEHKDNKSRTASESKDAKSKESKDSKSKSHSSKRNRDDSKGHSKHNGKTKTDSSDSTKSKDAKRSDKSSHKKDDRHHSSSHSSERKSDNKHDKDKKDPKKDIKRDTKDDHYSLKEKRIHRRSTDRDSSDGHSGTQSSSSSLTDLTTPSQLHKCSQESSLIASGGNSGDSGNSDGVNSLLENFNVASITCVSNDVPQLKLIKPKFASNIFEARRLMKIRKKLSKLEKQQIELMRTNNSTSSVVTDVNNHVASATNNDDLKRHPNILKKHLCKTFKVNLKNNDKEKLNEPMETLRNSFDEETVVEVVQAADDEAPSLLQTSVISKESWDAVEAKLNAQNILKVDYNSYTDSKETVESVKQLVNTQENNFKGFAEDLQVEAEKKSNAVSTIIEQMETELAKLSKAYLLKLAEKDKSVPQKGSEEFNQLNKLPKIEKVDVTSANNEIVFSPGRGIKRIANDHSDIHNNNKVNKQLGDILCVRLNDIADSRNQSTTKIKKPKLTDNSVNALENFNLPLSPADSDKSFNSINEKKNEAHEGRTKRPRAMSNQRYSSDDLYKPRLQFSSKRRRSTRNSDKN